MLINDFSTNYTPQSKEVLETTVLTPQTCYNVLYTGWLEQDNGRLASSALQDIVEEIASVGYQEEDLFYVMIALIVQTAQPQEVTEEVWHIDHPLPLSIRWLAPIWYSQSDDWQTQVLYAIHHEEYIDVVISWIVRVADAREIKRWTSINTLPPSLQSLHPIWQMQPRGWRHQVQTTVKGERYTQVRQNNNKRSLARNPNQIVLVEPLQLDNLLQLDNWIYQVLDQDTANSYQRGLIADLYQIGGRRTQRSGWTNLQLRLKIEELAKSASDGCQNSGLHITFDDFSSIPLWCLIKFEYAPGWSHCFSLLEIMDGWGARHQDHPYLNIPWTQQQKDFQQQELVRIISLGRDLVDSTL